MPTHPATRRTRRLVAPAAVLTLAAALAACGTTEPSGGSAAAADDERPTEIDTIVFDYPFTALPVFAALSQAVQEYADEQGVTVEITNDNMDLSTQVANLNSYLAAGDVDAVVSFPADNASIESIAEGFIAKGPYWVTYGGDLDSQDASLQFSFVESGRMLGANAGEWAQEALGGEGTVLVLGDDSFQIGRERGEGIRQGLEESAPDLEVVNETAITPDQGLKVTSTLLAQDPDIDIVLAASGDAAQGAFQALTQAGRDADDAQTYVGAMDGNPYILEQMAAGSMVRGVVTVKIPEVAQAVVDIPKALAAGEDVDSEVPVYLVTPDSPDLADWVAAFGG